MRVMRFPLGLALAATMLVGCATAVVQRTTPQDSGAPINLFANPDGLGRLTMRLVDLRQGRSVQSVSDADDWNQVQVKISSAKLRAPREASMSLGDGNFTTLRQASYSVPQMAQLPPANDYQVLVAIASGSALLGQGASDSINVPAGGTVGVTIFINAVGNIGFYNSDYFTATGSAGLTNGSLGFPELVGSTSVDVQTFFANSASEPVSQKFAWWTFDVKDLSDNVLVSSASIGDVSTTVASKSFTVPDMPSNEFIGKVIVYGRNNTSTVLSTKQRNILILRGATISATLN